MTIIKSGIVCLASWLAFGSAAFAADAYLDNQGNPVTKACLDYKAMGSSYRSAKNDHLFCDSDRAQWIVQQLPAKKGMTVGQYLNQKAKGKGFDDFGWNAIEEGSGFIIERRLLLFDRMSVNYRWSVDQGGHAKAVNGHALEISR